MKGAGKVAGLFAGIGGLELGLKSAGFKAEVLCEIDDRAVNVLQAQFPGVDLLRDVRTIRALPEVEVVAAGFPCQDLSQAGGKEGIVGERSGLVAHLLSLLHKARKSPPRWVVVENVSYMLSLDKGQAMSYLTRSLEDLGYRWAYRVADARAFGVPQRRLRVLLVASLTENPCDVLFADNFDDPAVIIADRVQSPLVADRVGPSRVETGPDKAYGFYWTEGRIGIGWASDAVPPIKGGSGLGIPSPPAVWRTETNEFGVPSIEDGERLQGFPAGWTEPATSGSRALGPRWKLVGNAVCVPAASWLAHRLAKPGTYRPTNEREHTNGRWPLAAHGGDGRAWAVPLSVWPRRGDGPVLSQFLQDPLKPLSHKAAAGFLDRARRTPKIRYSPVFLEAVSSYLESVAGLA